MNLQEIHLDQDDKPINGSIWYTDGLLSRIYGPAVEYSNGSNAWFVNGNEVPNEWLDDNVADPHNINKDEQVLMKLAWG